MISSISTPEDLSFSALFDHAVADWPDVVDVHLLLPNTARSDLYVISGLGQKGDEIAAKYFGKNDEILMRNLQEAICSTIRLAARFCNEIRPAALRRNVVKEEFEQRIQLTINSPDLGWGNVDVLLVNRYLLANQ